MRVWGKTASLWLYIIMCAILEVGGIFLKWLIYSCSLTPCLDYMYCPSSIWCDIRKWDIPPSCQQWFHRAFNQARCNWLVVAKAMATDSKALRDYPWFPQSYTHTFCVGLAPSLCSVALVLSCVLLSLMFLYYAFKAHMRLVMAVLNQ